MKNTYRFTIVVYIVKNEHFKLYHVKDLHLHNIQLENCVAEALP